jgi:dihydroneopterin aldolase
MLTGLRVRGYHGVFASERTEGQDFIVDVVLETDFGEAAASDDLARTVDYGALANALAEVVGGEAVNLLETLAERLSVECLSDARVIAAEVTVHKPQAPVLWEFADVAVSIRRERRGRGGPAGRGEGERGGQDNSVVRRRLGDAIGGQP